jgi:hypothetical protein
MGPLKYHAKIATSSVALQGPKDTSRPRTFDRILKKAQPILHRPLKRLNQHLGRQDEQDPAQTDRPPRVCLSPRVRPLGQVILRWQRRYFAYMELLEILVEKEVALPETVVILLLNGRPENQRSQQDHRDVIDE